MSTINQKEYLKKYLSLGNEPGKKKKRKKKPSIASNRVKIIDDDVDVTFNEAVEEDLHGLMEDAPQIVGVIDDRPLELRIGDYRDSDLWKPVGVEDSTENIANHIYTSSAAETSTKNPSEKANRTMQSSSDDYSPPRKRRDSDTNSRIRNTDRNYDSSPKRRSGISASRRSKESSDEDYKQHRNTSKNKESGRYGESPTRRSRRDSDKSPPRRSKVDDDKSSLRGIKRERSDSDRSPVRRNKIKDEDISPSRRNMKDFSKSPVRRTNRNSDFSPKRKYSDQSSIRRNKDFYDRSPRTIRRHSDASPKRKNSDRSPFRRNKVDEDISPPRRTTKDYDKSPIRTNKRSRDISPKRKYHDTSPKRKYNDRSPARRNKAVINDSAPRRYGKDYDRDAIRHGRRSSDKSPVRRNKADDTSPPRRNLKDYGKGSVERNRRSKDASPRRSPIRRNKVHDERSPPRRYNNSSPSSRTTKNTDTNTNRNQRVDYQGPSYIRRYNYEETRESTSLDHEDYDKHKSSKVERSNRADERHRSPLRRRNSSSDTSPNRNKYEKREDNSSTISKTASRPARKSRWDDETPALPPAVVIHIEKKSGLQRANELIQQNEFFKDIAGPSTSIVAPIVRDRKTGKIRDFKKEEEDAVKKQEKEDEIKAKYDQWGKGLKQVEEATDKLYSDLHEMNKPLARYADDEDLEKHLKEMERDGDPMLAYLRKKKRRNDEEAGKPFKPQFEGEFMPNRYGIRPGHRWDGVDRSSGYEKKWFEVMNSRRAQQDEAYKWSTEDM